MQIDEAVVDRLIDAIYDATVDPSRWQKVFEGLCAATESRAGLFAALDRVHPERSAYVTFGLDPDVMPKYVKEHLDGDPWAITVSRLPAGTVSPLDAHVPAADLVKTRFYDEILRQQGILHCGTAVLVRSPERSVAFSVHRGAKKGPYEADELRLLSILAPHFTRAAQIAWRIGRAAAVEAAKAAILDSLDEGVVLVDGHGRVLFANRLAESILALRDGLAAGPDGLAAAAPSDRRRLQNLLADAATRRGGGTMRVTRPSSGEPFLVFVAPLPPAAPWLDQYGPAAVVFVCAPELMSEPDLPLLMQLFELTATEAKVALSIADGKGVPATARVLRMSTHTVHTHLKRIFAKLDINHQAELVRILLTMPLRRPNDLQAQRSGAGPVTLPPDSD